MEIVSLLQSCLDEVGVKVRVNSLVNDTVGALLAHGYQSKGPALLGAIFGTGTNGAYVEERSKITKLEVEDPLNPRPDFMIINAEWGGFDDERNILPVTPFDNVVDRTAIRPRHHAFEKMISGMYLGEISRIVLLHLVDLLLLFKGYSSIQLNTQYAFDTAYMSAIMEDTKAVTDQTSATRKVLLDDMKIPLNYISDEDIDVVRKVCHIVGKRAARLSAVAVAAVVQHRQGPKVELVQVGVDGSVVEYLPLFTDRYVYTAGADNIVLLTLCFHRMREALAEMLGSEVEKATKFGLAKDGSGVGGEC
jgi:hexokinase